MKDPADPSRHDVYGMLIVGFKNPLIVLFYLVSITLLCSHLSHGIASIFQTLGLRTEKTRLPIERLGLAISVLLWIGFLSIPLLIVTGVLTDTELASMATPEAPAVPNP
jgi:succinate dehydrogenase / fumarate reductase cytochrome b subunit